jgi:hypothetical protein
MNKAITEGLVLMPPPFSAGLDLWSREDGLPGQGSYQGQPNAAYVPADQDFAGCLELQKTSATQKLRCFQNIPVQPGLYLRVTARVKAISGALPTVAIAGWAGSSGGANVTTAVQVGPGVALTAYGTVVTVSAIVGSGNRQGVDMVWGATPAFGHFGLNLTGANGGVVRIDDIEIEDVTSVFHAEMFNWVDVRDYGAVGDGVTDDRNAFEAADAAAQGRAVVVSPGTYFLGAHMTFDNPVRFEGTVIMPEQIRLACTRDFNLETYSAAFGSELQGFRKALQALFYFTDHVALDLKGRRVELTGPIDVAALAGLTTFSQRRVLCNGQLTVAAGAAWDTETVTATGTYSTSASQKLTGVTNIGAIPVGARISGTGVGREVYVTARNVAAATLDLSAPLVGGSGTRSYTFQRYRYMLDFSGFDELSKFELADLEILCGGGASGVLLPKTGNTQRIADCVFNKPKDRGLTSFAEGCQGMMIDNCQFLSNEQEVAVQDRTTIMLNVNQNDVKIRNCRSVKFATTAVMQGTGHMFTGNHFFQGDGEPSGIRRAGIVLTTPNCKTLITGNYIDNCFVEMTNEHADQPNFAAQYSFGGLTVTGNTFTAQGVASWFSWLVVTPRGTGHFVSGLTVIGNVFRTRDGDIDRVEKVDTTYAPLSYASFRNVTFASNTFNGVTQATSSPILVRHTQTTAADTWTVDGSGYMPFLGRARNVTAVTLEGALANSSNAVQWAQPYVLSEQGVGGGQVQLKWPSAVKGKALVTIRCDNPL